MFDNKQKLLAVLNYWAQPVITYFLQNKINLPGISLIDNKVRSTGWVSPNWSVMNDLTALATPCSYQLLMMFLYPKIQNVSDDMIPALAHSICDAQIKNGGLSLFEGNVKFSVDDLKELKKLLNINLPNNNKIEQYTVLTEEINNENQVK